VRDSAVAWLEVGGKSEVRVAHAGAVEGMSRNGAIDLLRGWAVLSVMLLHLNIRVPFAGCWLGRSLPKPLFNLIFWSGYPAVLVFFVISGFLITSMSEARWGSLARIRVRHFYGIRFARLAPTLLLFVVVQSFLQSAGVNGFSDPRPAASLATTIFSVLTFHLNWLEAKVGYLPGAWDVLWSLCVEELFYFGFPLLARVARARFVFYSVLLAFVIAGPFARVSTRSNEMWQDHSYLSCMGEIAIGCLAALLVRRHPPGKRAAFALLAVGAGLMSFVLYFRRAVSALGLYSVGLNVTLLSCGTAAVLIAVTGVPGWSRTPRRSLLSPLRWLGRNSYEVYLSHLFVIIPAVQLWQRFGRSDLTPVFYLAVIVAAALLGALIAENFSKPLSQRLRARVKTLSW
jgi:peptidoglycan/LPS O-acetylase OafA/YrhL